MRYMTSRLKRTCLIGLILLLFLPVSAILFWRSWLNLSYSPYIYANPAEVPPQRVALVFGAGIRNNRPTPVLADRIKAAVALYQAGKVQKLLLSGDNSIPEHNEPGVMAAYAQELGVPAADIVLDYAGRRTYDSCYRAKVIFGVEAAVLVTQEFHQARAVYLCDQLGIVAVGLSADQSRYSHRSRFSWSIRETLASTVAWWDINILHPIPILGDKLPIGE